MFLCFLFFYVFLNRKSETYLDSFSFEIILLCTLLLGFGTITILSFIYGKVYLVLHALLQSVVKIATCGSDYI